MYPRFAVAFVALALIGPASADELMKPEEARHFVVGKLFSYTCFEGTRGSGRIYPDGSVAGTIQVRGHGRVHFVRLPANTLQVRGESICATVPGLPFSPCFNVAKTSSASFRGSIYGLRFAYCDFNRHGHRIDVAQDRARSEAHADAHTHRRPHARRTSPPQSDGMSLRTAIDEP